MRTWLREIRKGKNFTLKQVAKKSGISESAYCLIERVNRNPSVNVAKKIAKALSFSWTRFYEEEQ